MESPPEAPVLTGEEAQAHLGGIVLAMTRAEALALEAACYAAVKAMDRGDEDFHVSVPTNYDVERAEHYSRMIRSKGFDWTLRAQHRSPMSGTRRLTSRPRERRSSAGRRRASSTTRDDGASDSEGPPRRSYVVDDHYLVVGVVG